MRAKIETRLGAVKTYKDLKPGQWFLTATGALVVKRERPAIMDDLWFDDDGIATVQFDPDDPVTPVKVTIIVEDA